MTCLNRKSAMPSFQDRTNGKMLLRYRDMIFPDAVLSFVGFATNLIQDPVDNCSRKKHATWLPLQGDAVIYAKVLLDFTLQAKEHLFVLYPIYSC